MDILPAGFDPNAKWRCTGCFANTSGIICPSCETLNPAIPPEAYEKYKEAEKSRIRMKLFGSTTAPAANSSSSIFGAPTGNVSFGTSSIFGANGGQSSGLFGNNASGSSLFGNTGGSSLFGNNANNSSGGSLFGSGSASFTFTSSAPGASIGFQVSEAKSYIKERSLKTVSRPVEEKNGSEPIGRMYIHGNGECDQLGMGAKRERRRPTLMEEISNLEVISVAAGAMHTVVLTKSGETWSWGCNDAGALGRAGVEELPEKVTGIPKNIKYFTCGDSHTIGLTSTGEVWAFGRYSDSQGAIGFPPTKTYAALKQTKAPLKLDLLPPISKIESGLNHTAAISSGLGDLLMWGDSECGQLGITPLEGGKQKELLKPIIRNWKELGLEGEIKNVWCVPNGTFIQDVKNNVYATGLNTFGQLGTGTTTNVVSTFTQVSTLKSFEAVKIIVGSAHHTMALTEDGKVLTWGKGEMCGIDKPSPVLIPTLITGLENVRQISCGANHAMVVTIDGGIYTWGQGDNWQLGNGLPEQDLGDDLPLPHFMSSKQLDPLFILAAVGGSAHTCELAWVEGKYRTVQEKDKIYAEGAKEVIEVAVITVTEDEGIPFDAKPLEVTDSDENVKAVLRLRDDEDERDVTSDFSGDEDDLFTLSEEIEADLRKRHCSIWRRGWQISY